MNESPSAAGLRLAVFLGLLAALLIAERLFPRRRGDLRRGLRWPANLGLAVVDSLLVLALPLAALGAAALAARRDWGLLNAWDGPAALEFGLALLALDLAIYWQHRWLHEIRWLWPLHRVHHSDIEFDTTTAVRFHPLEIVLSMAYKIAVVLALGAPLAAVLLFEALLSSFALFSHANLRLPARLDRALRWVFITPEMHRIHHSVWRAETDSNYGNCLTLWDRLFGSYVAEPRDGHEAMRIGLPELRGDPEQHLGALLLQPLGRRAPAVPSGS